MNLARFVLIVPAVAGGAAVSVLTAACCLTAVAVTVLGSMQSAGAFGFYVALLVIHLLWFVPVGACLCMTMGVIVRRARLTPHAKWTWAVSCGVLSVIGRYGVLPRWYVSVDRPWCHDAPSLEGIVCMYLHAVFGLPIVLLLPIFSIAGFLGGLCFDSVMRRAVLRAMKRGANSDPRLKGMRDVSS